MRPRPNKTRTIWLEERNQKMMKPKDDSYYFNLQEKLYCFDFRRNYSEEMDKLSNAISENVSMVLMNVLDKRKALNNMYLVLDLQTMNIFI